jgi:hypothetical protein
LFDHLVEAIAHRQRPGEPCEQLVERSVIDLDGWPPSAVAMAHCIMPNT